MITNNDYRHKNITSSDKRAAHKAVFDFPEHGLSIEANSYEEALQLLKEKLKQ